MKLHLFFLSLLFPIIKSYVFISIDLLCDDYCKDILLDGISIKDEINLDTQRQYYFREIKYIVNPNQLITFSTLNSGDPAGITARITLMSNANSYIYDTTSNSDLFSCNVTATMNKNKLVTGSLYNGQNESYKGLYKELQYCLGPKSGFKNKYIDFYFTIPMVENEIEFICENVEEWISDNYYINISKFIINSNERTENYNFLYFTQYDNEELIGKFYLNNSGREIRYEEFYAYEEIIKYEIKYNKVYYVDKIIFIITHNDYFVPTESAYIKLTVCPNYCIKCDENKICESIYNNNELYEEFLENTAKKYYNQIIKSRETEEYLLTSSNNFFQKDLYSQPDLNNCGILLKNYFTLDNYNITVVYIEEDSTKIIY